MDNSSAVSSPWTDALKQQREPEEGSLREHLREVHRRDPGFTERCATQCRDSSGRTSYEWLCEAAQTHGAINILDLACGSGFLLATCLDRCSDAERLIGVDMSPDELALAESRLSSPKIALMQGHAQDLGFIDRHSQDAVLCHWALTLMEPLDPVLEEIRRIIKPGGLFAAIIDGDPALAPQYHETDALIFDHVSRVIPGYGDRDLGDPRVRNPDALADLCRHAFEGAEVAVESSVFSLNGNADAVAEEALGFYYAAFVLPQRERQKLVNEIAHYLAKESGSKTTVYNLPICRLSVKMTPA